MVISIGDKLRDSFEWFGHVQCRLAMVPLSKSFSKQVGGPTRRRCRPKRTWMDIIQINLKKCNLSEDLTQYRSEWRNRNHVAKPNIVGTRL